MSDTHTLDISIWEFAPERWVDPGIDDEFEVLDAAIVGESGEEELVVEIERIAECEVSSE